MAEDQHLLWTTKGSQTAVKDQDYLDPYSMYDFFNAANATRVHQRRLGMRARSAAPRLGTRQSIDTDSEGNSFKMHTYLRNPSPTPATSPPLSVRSGQSRFNSATSSKHVVSAKQSSPTSLYLGFHKTRCKSAPPRPVGYYLPKRPKTAKSQPRLPVSSFGNGPKRAWRNRTRSAKDCHSLLSPEEVNQRHKERCKSAPLPYDFSSIEHVTSVHAHSSDIQKLKALTRPLTCMPEVVQSVLSSNNLRHCCSAYHLRPKTSTNMKQQFWPVTRPAVFQRGNVVEYLHFVKPAGLWVHGAGHIHHSSAYGDNATGTDDPNVYDMSTGTNLSIHGSDEMDDTFLHEEQFLVSAAPSVESLSDQENWPELEVNGDVPAAEGVRSEDLDNEFLHVEEDADKPLDETDTQTLPVEEQEWDVKISQPHDQGLKITVTEVESLLVVQEPNKEHQEQRGPKDEEPTAQDVGLEIEVSTIPALEGKGTESGIETARDPKSEAPLKQDLGAEPSPVPVLEEPSEPANEPLDGDTEQHAVETSGQGSVVSKTPQVKFSEVLILTSFKAPGVKEEAKTLPRKPILNTTPAKKQAALPPVLEKPKLPQMEHQKKTGTTFLKPKAQLMTTTEKPAAHKEKEQKQEQEEKEAEAKEDEPLKLEAAVLPQPEYIHAPGAYRMYEPKDLLQYQMEQHRESKSKKKSLTASMIPFVPSAESSAVMTSILDDQKRIKEGMKPWLQGRLALSRQTSRFELPMDVRLLEDMTPMEYLTKYCIISTRRKALYKHIFQKVDRDRDNFITFKEMDKGLKDVHVDYINTEQVKKLVEMVDGTEKSMFNLQQFSAIAAFSERLLLSESQANEKERVDSSKEIIEEADFCGLKAKLSGFAVNPTVRKILEVL